jgi:hypothetical protein
MSHRGSRSLTSEIHPSSVQAEQAPTIANQVDLLLGDLVDRQAIELRLFYEPVPDGGPAELVEVGSFSLTPEATADLIGQAFEVGEELWTVGALCERLDWRETDLVEIAGLLDQQLSKEVLVEAISEIVERDTCPCCRVEAEAQAGEDAA